MSSSNSSFFLTNVGLLVHIQTEQFYVECDMNECTNDFFLSKPNILFPLIGFTGFFMVQDTRI